MVEKAFQNVLSAYLASNHRKKVEIIERAYRFAKVKIPEKVDEAVEKRREERLEKAFEKKEEEGKPDGGSEPS